MSAASFKYANAVFDLDGVIIDNSAGILESVCYTLDKMKLPRPSDENLRKFFGPAMGYSFRTFAGATEEQAVEAVQIYRMQFLMSGIDNYKIYSGIPEVIKTLCEKGVACSVMSNKPDAVVNYILRTAGLEKYITAVAAVVNPQISIGADEIIHKAVTVRPALVISDGAPDISAAKECGIDSAFVTYGFGRKDELTEKPTHTIHTPEDIIRIVF